MSKKYEFLRPFDLEAAKAGAPICYRDGDIPTSWFIHEDVLYAEWKSSPEQFAQFKTNTGLDRWRMAPLGWVEGRPVYKGDRLWRRYRSLPGEWVVVSGTTESSTGKFLTFEKSGSEWADNRDGDLSWDKPVTMVKKEGWINVYKRREDMSGCHTAFISHAFTSEAEAEQRRDVRSNFVKTIRIAWEEEA